MQKKYNRMILAAYIIFFILGLIAFKNGEPRIGLYYALGCSSLSSLNLFLEEKRRWLIIGRNAVVAILIIVLIIVRYTP